MLRAAVVQLTTTANLQYNLGLCMEAVHSAAALGAHCVFLPEASDFLLDTADAPPPLEACQDRRVYPRKALLEPLAVVCKELGVDAMVGVHWPIAAVELAGKLASTADSVSEDAHAAASHSAGRRSARTSTPSEPRFRNASVHLPSYARYDKLHLFDVRLPSGAVIEESRWTEAGPVEALPLVALSSSRTIASDDAAPVMSTTASSASVHAASVTSKHELTSTPSPMLCGMCICYDLRFPELAARYRNMGAHVLSYPAAFTVDTGRAGHWSTLLRARAIETQCYVVASAQYGLHGKTRRSWGEAMIVDPWGRVMARCPSIDDEGDDDKEGVACTRFTSSTNGSPYWVAVADMSLSEVEEVRVRMPVHAHRRL